jgi:hypothetical protein
VLPYIVVCGLSLGGGVDFWLIAKRTNRLFYAQV